MVRSGRRKLSGVTEDKQTVLCTPTCSPKGPPDRHCRTGFKGRNGRGLRTPKLKSKMNTDERCKNVPKKWEETKTKCDHFSQDYGLKFHKKGKNKMTKQRERSFLKINNWKGCILNNYKGAIL